MLRDKYENRVVTAGLDRALAEFERESARRKLADVAIEEALLRG